MPHTRHLMAKADNPNKMYAWLTIIPSFFPANEVVLSLHAKLDYLLPNGWRVRLDTLPWLIFVFYVPLVIFKSNDKNMRRDYDNNFSLFTQSFDNYQKTIISNNWCYFVRNKSTHDNRVPLLDVQYFPTVTKLFH